MKSTQATIRQRVDELLTIRLQGAEFADIRQYASQQSWNVSDRQLWRYIADSDALLQKTLEKDRARLFNRHIAQRRALYARCMAVSDYSNARAVLKDEAELLNLYPPKRTELTGKDGGPLQTETVVMTEDERRTAIHAILEAGSPGPDLDGKTGPLGPALGEPGAGDDEGGPRTGPVADSSSVFGAVLDH